MKTSIVFCSALAAFYVGYSPNIFAQSTVSKQTPTGEFVARWEFYKKNITLFDVNKLQITKRYTSPIPIDTLSFSLSGRYICISSEIKVLFIDTENGWRITGERTFDGANEFECQDSGSSVNSKISFEARSNRTIVYTEFRFRGKTCSNGKSQYIDKITYYVDPTNGSSYFNSKETEINC